MGCGEVTGDRDSGLGVGGRGSKGKKMAGWLGGQDSGTPGEWGMREVPEKRVPGSRNRAFPWGSRHLDVDGPAPLCAPQNQAERGHKVRMVVGSGLRPDTWERFVRRFGPLQVLETYGLTEGNVATFNYTGRRGAVGRASWLYKHVFPFSLIRYDVTTGEPFRDTRGHCVATSPGLCSGGVGGAVRLALEGWHCRVGAPGEAAPDPSDSAR